MPDLKTHHNHAFVMVSDLGLNAGRSAKVAWADQMTDVATPEWLSAHFPDRLLLPTQCVSFGGVGIGGVSRSSDLDPRVWIWSRFHFPCGHLSRPPRLRVLDRLIRAFHDALRAGLDIEAGILLHVIQDELCVHQFFHGCHSEHNRKRPAGKRETVWTWLTMFAAPPIGHAEYGGAIDDVDCPTWIAPDGSLVDNPSLWRQMVVAVGAPANVVMERSKDWVCKNARAGIEAALRVPEFQADAFDALSFLRIAAALPLPMEV